MTSDKAKASSRPILWGLAAAALFGASTPASKPLLASFNPVLLSGILYLGAAVSVAPWALRGWRGVKVDRKNGLRLAGAVVFGGIAGPVLLLYGLSLASAGSVSLWLNLETVGTAVLARLYFKEHLGRSTWLAVALIVCASVLLSPATPGGGPAVALVALACIAWGLDNNLTSVIDGFSPSQITFAKGAVAGSVNLGLGLTLAAPRELAAGPVGLALLIGGLSYGASLLLYIKSAQHLGATRSQLIFSTAPAWGLVLSWTTLNEEVQLAQVGAAALMGVAIWMWHREHHAHPHAHSATVHRHWHCHDDAHHEHEHAIPIPRGAWHCHTHGHEYLEHTHGHRPDIHHRHDH